MICTTCNGSGGDLVLEVDRKAEITTEFAACDTCGGAGKLDPSGNRLNGMYYNVSEKMFVSYSQGTLYWSGEKCEIGNREWEKATKERRSI